ncbi:hypothetical protein OGAPHI_005300 [Ogataea philodendri]|uniref:Uncharacterized protein n=1 Tax=Ogataea philodendri TaxID=1378263 RepID=A0A9P8P1B1_9ASCO|nr:uncharacterized protein OGAPHI_005300 [Ogataea philodendri]KAH3663310.1 hypothetical protein OGAPHI_005300 [Ogataea philodendri]
MYVISESRQDFEDGGIDEQTLLDLKRIWRDKLSKTGVAMFSWDLKRDEYDDSSNLLGLGDDHISSQTFQEQFNPAVPDTNSGLHIQGLHLPQSDLALPTNSIKGEDDLGINIALPGGGRIGQSDGTVSFTLEGAEAQQLAKKLRRSQVDGAGDLDDEGGDDLGSDLGVGSDEINSDLDDPDDDEINSGDDNEDQEYNIMLCLYDRVQRVKNKWKCNLKDGIANIDGRDYAFQKATGESECVLRTLRNKAPAPPPKQTDAAPEPLTPAELEAIANIQSSLYQPKNPFLEPSKADLIQKKIDAIADKLERHKQIEEAKYRELLKEQEKAAKPNIGDFRRPIASFLLLGSAVYLLLQYLWHTLEAEEHVISMEQKTREYEREIQALLDKQTPKKKWLWF